MKRTDLSKRNHETFLKNAASHIGETIHNKKYGLDMTIVAWRGNNDIDVQFSDGTLVSHQYYQLFKKQTIKYPNYYEKYRIGETRTMKSGLTATVIGFYGNAHSRVNLRFSDGMIRENVPYRDFLSGVAMSHRTKTNRIGETHKQLGSHVAEIIEYVDNANITVRFEDNEIKKTTYDSFIRGIIDHPIFNTRHQFNYNGFVCRCRLITDTDTYFICRHSDGFQGILTPNELRLY